MNQDILLAIEAAEREESLLLPSFQEYPYVVSERHKKRIERLIKKLGNPFHIITYSTAKKVACILLAFLTISFTTVMSVEALRVPFVKFVKETFEKFIEITYSSDESSSEQITDWIDYIPKGYTLTQKNETHNMEMYIYENSDNGSQIFIKRYYITTYNIQLDNEAETESISINGNNALFIQKLDTNYVSWESDGEFYQVYGNVDKKIILKIAKSIK